MKTSKKILRLCLASLPLLTTLPSQAQEHASTPRPAAEAEGNSEHLSADTIRAKFRGLRELPASAHSVESNLHAIFEVTESLAYQIDSPHGTPRLQPGDQFSVNLAENTPGQPNSIIKDVLNMKEGDTAVMLMCTLFLRDGHDQSGGRIIRPCTRFSPDAVDPHAAPPAAHTQPRAGIHDLPDPRRSINHRPGRQYQRSNSRSVSINIVNGQAERIERVRSYDPNTDTVLEQLFINGVEVDPRTRQPLQSADPSEQVPALPPMQQPDPDPTPQPRQAEEHEPTQSEKDKLSF